MAFANGSERRTAYVAETVFGETPATPSFKALRITGGSLRTTKGTVTSDEIQADRNVRDELMVSQDVTGSYDFELSGETFDDFIAAALRGGWTANVLKNGILRPSFTVEETINFGGTNSFSRFRGVAVNTMSLNLPSRQKVTGSFGLMGAQESIEDAIVTGATYAAANVNQPATASANVGTVNVGGTATPFRVKSLSLEVNNELRVRDAVGTMFSAEFGAGRSNVTGTLECYFEGNDQYQAVLDHGSGAISFTVGVEANKKYTILVPKARFLDGARNPGGNTDDAMLSLPFRGIYDDATQASIQITRAVA
ncbi:phage tail protein [Methylobacterium sp. Leaf123]|uniref:phage tail tube protein n=1 Tax=Methylobacterium sp. Leaf123 TaxID=1736264 RepID=UPI0006F23015|nr:phage tail tube protein [Methylobacterium sp. Leaf123]KQQ13283.1 phage tail protein [Methylobacterium sp. Leaf123]